MKLFNRRKLRELLAEYKQVRRLQANELKKHFANEPYATTSENAFKAYKVSWANYCRLRDRLYVIMTDYCRITGVSYKKYVL